MDFFACGRRASSQEQAIVDRLWVIVDRLWVAPEPAGPLGAAIWPKKGSGTLKRVHTIIEMILVARPCAMVA